MGQRNVSLLLLLTIDGLRNLDHTLDGVVNVVGLGLFLDLLDFGLLVTIERRNVRINFRHIRRYLQILLVWRAYSSTSDIL